MKRITNLFALTLITALSLSACNSARQETAARIAGPAFMVDRQLQAGDFTLTLFERIHDRGGVAQIYIEGDHIDTSLIRHLDEKNRFDATPSAPVALSLAAKDPAKNVIYIARPCQYSQRKSTWKATPNEGKKCDQKYTTTHRFAPEVIASYNAALDEIKLRWGVGAFNIYGHSGGGTIGALLASQRKDILSLTTIAGNLDHRIYSHYYNIPAEDQKFLAQTDHPQFAPMTGSLNAADIAKSIKNVPQYHYIGGQDTIMPPATLHSFLRATETSRCIQHKIIPGNTHTTGWADSWASILKDKPKCKDQNSLYNIGQPVIPAPWIEPIAPQAPIAPKAVRTKRAIPSEGYNK